MTLLRKLHTYTALATFINLMVFGIVGLWAAFLPRVSPPSPAQVYYQPFAPEGNLTDRQVAERVCALLHLSLATPVQDAAIQHDAANRLVLDFYHANGRHRVTVLEDQRQLRIERMPNSLWRYLDILHMTTGAFRSGDWRMTLWADYNEFAMWSLGAMLLSGAVLGLAARRARLAWIALATGVVLFAVLLVWIG
jgi:hypothetical protein